MGAQADQVRDDILGRVRSRELMPGDRIDETDLRERLSLSGTPVREALISLEATGIVQRIPRGGARITSLDLEGLMKMIEVLAEIEGAVVYRAARRINTAQAEILQQATQACLDHANGKEQPHDSYYDVNLAFHTALVEAAGNQHLEEVTYQVGNRLIGYLSARHNLPGEPQRSANDHVAICEAVLEAKGDLARDLMIRHVIFSDTLALDVMNAMRNAND
ncbi:GntR family transcriptional regulator [Leisingera sp. JC11]|uniref:GntR family transcriptional regulator n=1 Tax=Leisingera sp. JC11 TaxID=3042469 RepID=UPI0034573497